MTSPKEIPSESTRRLLANLEDIIGHNFYNCTTKNFSGHDELDDGRWIRYPVTIQYQGKPDKFRKLPASVFSNKEFLAARYVMGVNQLFIVQGLLEVLRYLEQNHGLVLPVDPPPAASEAVHKGTEEFAKTNQRIIDLLGGKEKASDGTSQQ